MTQINSGKSCFPAVAPFLMEFIGTFFLTFASSNGNPLALGSALMVMVYMGQHVSGGHYNPAVTEAIYIAGRNKISWKKALGYVVAQLLGGLVGGCAGYGVFERFYGIAPEPRTSGFHALIIEFLWTFALASVVLHTTTVEAVFPNSYYGLATGFTVIAGGYSTGILSGVGSAFNQAVGVGKILVYTAFLRDDKLKWIWIYALGPTLGGAFAGLIFRITNFKEYNSNNEETNEINL